MHGFCCIPRPVKLRWSRPPRGFASRRSHFTGAQPNTVA
nr:MAG TPA: hypothetical protein [Caudoviricetes sp.]